MAKPDFSSAPMSAAAFEGVHFWNRSEPNLDGSFGHASSDAARPWQREFNSA
jgi:hypothetical protein